MKIVAIIAEYNPLHTGHIHHIETVRSKLSPDVLVVVMSGNFTQRGDVAIIEKHRRAVAAVKAGADIVLELPFLYAVNCAEKFADGAMKTLSCLNSPLTVSFGSECGDLKLLQYLSEKTHNESEEESCEIKKKLAQGERLIKVRADILDTYGNFTPNNVLGMEYVRAAKAHGFFCHTISREGGYNDDVSDAEFASANAIRNYILLGKTNKILQYLPVFMQDDLKNCIGNESICDMLLYKILFSPTDYLKNINEVSEGLENRIIGSAKKSFSYTQLTDNIKSKRYTMARIKRIMLYVLTSVSHQDALDMYDAPAYSRVLALKRGYEGLLSTLTNPIIKYSDVAALPDLSKRLIDLENRADDVYQVASKTEKSFNTIFTD